MMVIIDDDDYKEGDDKPDFVHIQFNSADWRCRGCVVVLSS